MQLRHPGCLIEYKAQRAGIPVRRVDPRNISRTCSTCGQVDPANRRSQDTFLCTQCGCAGHADYFAVLEIQRRATVRTPHVGSAAERYRLTGCAASALNTA
ncbi:MAG: transposase [Chloroflexi bacterium]|nr:transposase [Chloroflexota bacterium]